MRGRGRLWVGSGCGEIGVQEWDLGCRGGRGLRTGCRARIWGAVLGFEGQGRRGMQWCVQPWDLGCRGGLGCKHRTWGSGGNLGFRGRSGVQTRVAEGDLGYRKKSEVQGEIWGVQTQDLEFRNRSGVQREIWGLGGDFGGAQGDLGHTLWGAGASPFPEAGQCHVAGLAPAQVASS